MKKIHMTISTLLTYIVLILAVVSMTLFIVNTNEAATAGLFGTGSTTRVMASSICEIVFPVIIIALSELDFKEGLVADIIDAFIWACKVIVCILPVLALISFLGLRVQGLSNLYFSDENIQATLQTSENLAAASLAIKGLVMYGVTAVIACVAVFFRPHKNAKKTAVAAETVA